MTDREYKEYIEMIHGIVVPSSMPNDEKGKRYQPWANFLLKHTPEKLYRFRSCKERAFSELDKGVLGFSPGYKMNDIYDGLLYFDKEKILSGLNRTLKNDNLNKLLRSFGMEPKAIKQLFDQFYSFIVSDYDKNMETISHIVQSSKIVSLCEEIGSAAMWGYYADDGKGFAVSYDFRGFSRSDCFLVPVIYDNKRFDATEFATWIFQQQVIVRILCQNHALNLQPMLQQLIPCPDEFMYTKALIHKSESWCHEKEWRLTLVDLSGKEHPSIQYEPTAIYLGCRTSEINAKKIESIASKRGIPLYKMEVVDQDMSYSLQPVRLM